MMNYGKQHISLKDLAAVRKALLSDKITQGPIVKEFEDALAGSVGAKYGVAVNSGTAALTIAYQASGASRIVTTLNTFVATVNAAILAGLETVELRDISMENGCWVPPHSATPGDVYVPVHYAGNQAMIPDEIRPQTIEDSCHSMTYQGDTLAACFSFHPVKHITTGEGGMIVTNNKDFYKTCLDLRDHGRHDGWVVDISGNYRMSDIQAALGLSQLESIGEKLLRRVELMRVYHRELYGTPVRVTTDNENPHIMAVLCENRDGLQKWLAENGVSTAIHYPPVNMHPIYHSARRDRTRADKWYEMELSLPLYPDMRDMDARRVCKLIKEFYAHA